MLNVDSIIKIMYEENEMRYLQKDVKNLNEGRIYEVNKKIYSTDYKTQIIENPTKAQFKNVYEKTNEIRGFATVDKIYIWDALINTHRDTRKQLLEQFGIELTNPYCGFVYYHSTLGVNGYKGNDENEEFAKNILLNNPAALYIFSEEEIKDAPNYDLL